MLINTLTCPIILRDYLMQDEGLRNLLTYTRNDGGEEVKIYPLNAPTDKDTKEPAFNGAFVTFSRSSYKEEEGGNINYRVSRLEVECFSPEYDEALFDLLSRVERVIIRMKNDGFTISITDADEYQFAFKEGGHSWYCERVYIDFENVAAEREE